MRVHLPVLVSIFTIALPSILHSQARGYHCRYVMELDDWTCDLSNGITEHEAMLRTPRPDPEEKPVVPEAHDIYWLTIGGAALGSCLFLGTIPVIGLLGGLTDTQYFGGRFLFASVCCGIPIGGVIGLLFPVAGFIVDGVIENDSSETRKKESERLEDWKRTKKAQRAYDRKVNLLERNTSPSNEAL